MEVLRRITRLGMIATLALATLGSCTPSEEVELSKTRVYVLGTIHRDHRESERYSLDILAEAIRRADPDQILAEIPPDRIAEAYRSFREEGKVTEPRTRVFPEYVDVAFPLTKEMDVKIIPTAGWTQKIADDRSAALKHIEETSDRAQQWAEHLAARREFSRVVGNRGDDPLFIHSDAYDAQVKKAQRPYQVYFEPDLGAGGWIAINAAHNALINAALDEISGQGLTVVITFGAWHKYMILDSLRQRSDVVLLDARDLFR